MLFSMESIAKINIVLSLTINPFPPYYYENRDKTTLASSHGLLLIVRGIIYFCPKASFSPHYSLLIAVWPKLVLVSIIINTCLVIKLSSQTKGQRLWIPSLLFTSP